MKLVNQMPRNVAGAIIARQLMRAALSVGANAEEARGSTTKKEFSRKMSIALSEAREALYWLRLVAEGGLVAKNRLNLLVKEADELVRILTAIVKKSKVMGT
jgi:four helix bundle protein